MENIRKQFSAFLVIFLALFYSPTGWAGTTNLDDLELSGDLAISDDMTVDAISATGDVTFRSTLLANGRVGASTQLNSSSTRLLPTTLPYTLVLKNIGAGTGGPDALGGTGTELQNGTPGKTITFLITACSINSTWIVTPATSKGFSKLTFDTKGDLCTLLYVNDTIGWIIQANAGAIVTTTTFGGTCQEPAC